MEKIVKQLTGWENFYIIAANLKHLMRFFLSAILLCSSLFSKSQSQKKVSDSSNYFDEIQKDVVKFKPELCKDCTTFPFSNIKIIDKRYDTSAFGYMIIYKNVKKNCKLVTGNGLGYDLEKYLDDIYKNKFTSTNSSLVIVLRKFWFYGDYNFDTKSFFQAKSINYFLNLSIDCFLFSNEKYIPLLRKDTSIAVYEKIRKSENGTAVAESLRDVLNNLSLTELVNNISNKRKLNSEELNEYYDKNFQQPILNDAELKKGVYMSFDEFKKNEPSYTDYFDVRKTKLADDIYLINGKDTIPTRKAWGYCDGKNIYIKVDMNLFELNKQDRSFAFMRDKKLTHLHNDPLYYPYDNYTNQYLNLAAKSLQGLTTHYDKFKLTLVPLHLDMETGKVY